VRRFRFFRNPDPARFGANVETFLRALEGPTCILLEGRDRSRTRALVTLQHGNEPSGAIALLRYLQSGQQPAVNVVCIVPSVAAALEPPLFHHRMLPRARDLNRCYRPPFEDGQGKLAEEILEILHMHNPEAVVDMHNTSGSGPSFGVVTHMDRHHDALVSLFTQRLIISNLGLGALMEISESLYPTVTVEVGGRMDDEAHLLAYEGMCRYFNEEQVLASRETDWGLELLLDPIRLELREHTTLTYADHRSEHFDITLKTDIEHHNFGGVTADTLLGWVKEQDQPLFTATDKNGECAVDRLIRIDRGKLYPARDLKLFMITNNPDIASTDCLFYAVADSGQAVS
jgi:hypothetical protein